MPTGKYPHDYAGRLVKAINAYQDYRALKIDKAERDRRVIAQVSGLSDEQAEIMKIEIRWRLQILGFVKI